MRADWRPPSGSCRSPKSTFQALIDLDLDRGAGREVEDDIMLQAFRSVIVDRRERFEELKQITLYVSRPSGGGQPAQ
jgi:hypothetical protein